jgi:hypothetical protein
MPLHVIEADLERGDLIQVSAEETPAAGHVVAMLAIYRADSPPGPAAAAAPAFTRPRVQRTSDADENCVIKPCCHATRVLRNPA